MKNGSRLSHILASKKSLVVLAVLPLLCLTSASYAQLTVQSNPSFSTPTPGPVNLGPMPKPFKGDVVELQLDENQATPIPIKEHKDETLKINGIELEGNRYYSSWIIKRSLKSLINKTDEPVSYQEIENELKQINKFNNYKLKATIVKTGDGAGTIKLDAYEQQPLQIVGTFDNQGRPGVGTLRTGVQVVHDSLLGMGDQLKISYLTATRTRRIAGDYRLPVNRFGGAFLFHYDYQHYDYGPVSSSNRSFDSTLVGKHNDWDLTFEQPLDKNRVFTPYVGANFRHISIKNNQRTLSDPDNRTFTAGIRINKADKIGSTLFDASTTLGAKAFGGDFKFWRVKGTANRVINLPKNNKIVFRAGLQLTPDSLPTPVTFQIGGEYTVRGYTEGLLSGDRGHYVSIEHYWPVPFLGKASPYLAERIRGVSFFDFGQAWVDKSNARYVGGVSTQKERTTLMAAGVGVRARLTQYAQGFCDLAWGMGNRNAIELNANPTMRVHFGIRTELLPKEYRTRPRKEAKELLSKK